LTYSEAIAETNKVKWIEATNEEKNSLKENKILEIINENQIRSKKLLQRMDIPD